jgi:hypothetical protein
MKRSGIGSISGHKLANRLTSSSNLLPDSEISLFLSVELEVRATTAIDFFPSTLEHRPLHTPEKVELKKYFALSGADEYEGHTPSPYAISRELADFEAWVWGLRFWGRECIIRGTVAALRILEEAWDSGLQDAGDDPVPLAAAHDTVLSPAEAASAALYWANIPGEEKALRIMELRKPLPEEWMEADMHEKLQAKPFLWGAMAAYHVIAGILIKRDPAAAGLAQACVGAVRVRMLAGRTAAQAVEDVKGRMILDLRAWMGYKW